MRRRLLTLCSALSLLLCVAIVVLWVRTASLISVLRYMPPVGGGRWAEYRLVSTAGRVGIWRIAGTAGPGAGPVRAAWDWTEHPARQPADWIVWGARWDSTREAVRVQALGLCVYATRAASPAYAGQFGVLVPYWLLLLAATTPPLLLLRRRRGDERRRRQGLCPACGYDLRASPDRCPECGATTTGVA